VIDKSIKKLPPKNQDLIPLTLVKNKRFKEIINLIHDTTILTNRDRYIYGYALFTMQQYLSALLTIWPLAAKNYPVLKRDCAHIAAKVFKDPDFLTKINELPKEILHTLFVITNNLMPDSNILKILKQRLLAVLWEQRDYPLLERILKSDKKEISGLLVENLSKLMFVQAANKLPANIAGFIGTILTGGTCLLIRTPIYHHDLAAAINSLANELKIMFNNLKINHSLAWDATLFACFVDYEAELLIEIVQLVVDNQATNITLLPTPSYFINHEATVNKIVPHFIPWLMNRKHELVNFYQASTHHAIIWAFGGLGSNINSILKMIAKNQLHPYLRLAIMLRVASLKKSWLPALVTLNDFAQLNNNYLFKNIAIKTAKLIFKRVDQAQIPAEFWQLLITFEQVLADPEISSKIMAYLSNIVINEQANQKTLNLHNIKTIAKQVNNYQLTEQINSLINKQQACLQLLLNINTQADRLINAVKDQATLKQHLTVIADCQLVTAEQLSLNFFRYTKTLLHHKKINKIINLKNILNLPDRWNKCECYNCQQQLYYYELPLLVKYLNLPVADLKKSLNYINLSNDITTTTKSLLVLADPFKTLSVTTYDPKRIIMQQVMKLMVQAPDQTAIFRQAQSELFTPANRFIHHYLRYLSYEEPNIKQLSPQEAILTTLELPDLEFSMELFNDN